ncbi:hypothetical protein EON64_07285 [archaeon]|nr:MAG: hypothetical protein EON64_07285 [archaeon]
MENTLLRFRESSGKAVLVSHLHSHRQQEIMGVFLYYARAVNLLNAGIVYICTIIPTVMASGVGQTAEVLRNTVEGLGCSQVPTRIISDNS